MHAQLLNRVKDHNFDVCFYLCPIVCVLGACMCDTYQYILCWLKYLLINQILLKLKYGVDKYLLLPFDSTKYIIAIGKHVLGALIQSYCLHGISNTQCNYKVRTISFCYFRHLKKVYLRLLHFQKQNVKLDRYL